MSKAICMGLLAWAGICLGGQALAQVPADTAKAAEEDFSAYGDADAPATSYCTQKVLYLAPTRLFSVGYEVQTPFEIDHNYRYNDPMDPAILSNDRVTRFGGLRFQTNTPIISRNNLIVNLGVNYWNSNVSINSGARNNFLNDQLSYGLRTVGLQGTVFKPLNNQHFLIFQAQADASGNYLGINEISHRNFTYSGTAIFGWKKSDNLMFGFGVTRTYRAGQVLHIPVVMYNHTFNQHWGIEAIAPARIALRYNFSPTRMLLLGYEIEGNAFYLRQNISGTNPIYPHLWLRRGELKPRLGYEQKLFGFVWLALQAGVRYNYRFEVHQSKDPKGDNEPDFKPKTGLPFYFNVSLNLVSP